MGIRVHKYLGYALPDFKPKDDRLAMDIWDDDVYESFLEQTVDQFVTDIGVKFGSRLDEKDPSKGYKNLKYVIRNNSDKEFETEITFLILRSCTYGEDWYRYDDSIDYYEEAIRPENQNGCRDRLDWLDRGIYPYSGSYQNARTGESLTRNGFCGSIRREYLDIAKTDPNQVFSKQWNLLRHNPTFWFDLGFENGEDFKRNCIHKIPEEIVEICEGSGIFKDPMTVYQLRPAIVTYWA